MRPNAEVGDGRYAGDFEAVLGLTALRQAQSGGEMDGGGGSARLSFSLVVGWLGVCEGRL